MAIRLTRDSREDAIEALLKKTFEKREEKARKRVHAAAVRLLKKQCGPKYKMLTTLPDGWAKSRIGLGFYIGGFYRSASLIEAVPVPAEDETYSTVEARDPEGIALCAALDEMEAIKTERRELKKKAEGITARFSTAEALAKEWPLIAPFLPKEALQLPALPIAEITEAFKKAAA